MENKCMITFTGKGTFPSVFGPAEKNPAGPDGCVVPRNVSVGAPLVFIMTGIIYAIIIASRLCAGEG